MSRSSTDLPLSLTSFIGREREVEQVKRLLSTTRLLTLTGSGGAGKTRLAIKVAEDSQDAYNDGVGLVEFASLSEPSLIPQTVASAFQIQATENQDVAVVLQNYLASRNLLLVLDNCEHLIQAIAELSQSLLHGCRNIRILATSREALNISGETLFRVPSLAFPEPHYLPSLEIAAQYESIRLLVERAQAAKPQFQLTNANLQSVAQICARLDGMPLAIELAAARVKTLGVEQIAAQLVDAFRLLTGGSRTALPRQQTLRATIDWSNALLFEQERVLFRRLSVFAGGWTLDAAEYVCADKAGAIRELPLQRTEVLDTLSRLVDKSLVIVEEQENSVRYRFLETIRQYAREKLVEAGEAEEWQSRQLEFFGTLAQTADPHLRSAEQFTWLKRLASEKDNLRAALEWALQPDGQAGARHEMGLELAANLARFWTIQGDLREGRAWLEKMLEFGEDRVSASAVRARAMHGAGFIAWFQDDYDQAFNWLKKSETMWQALADPLGLAYTRIYLAHCLWASKDRAAARSMWEEGIVIFQSHDDRWGEAWSLAFLGRDARDSGNYEQARPLYLKSAELLREIGDQWAYAIIASHLGTIAFHLGDYASARKLIGERLALGRKMGSKLHIALSLSGLGGIASAEGDYPGATELFKEALVICHQIGNISEVVNNLTWLAWLMSKQGQFERAVRLDAAASKSRGTVNIGWWPLQSSTSDTLEIARAQLDQDAFDAAWEEGRAMTLEQAIAQVEQMTFAPKPLAPSPTEFPFGLTAREVEVLRLLARGLANQQIADQLVLSKRTVDAHLSSIYSKLDVTTRSAATRLAIDQKIV